MLNKIGSLIKKNNILSKFFLSLNHRPVRVLDLGCGNSWLCPSVKECFPEAEIFGIDLIEDAQIPEFIHYRKVDLDKGLLPFENDFFDVIIFRHVIEHLRNPLLLGKEINRIMKHAAVVYIETPNWTSMLVPSFGFKREQQSPFNFFDDPSHVKLWSKHGLFSYITQYCNLRVRKIETVRNWLEIPFDPILILKGLLRGDRGKVIHAFWNLYGWCIYGIGVKD